MLLLCLDHVLTMNGCVVLAPRGSSAGLVDRLIIANTAASLLLLHLQIFDCLVMLRCCRSRVCCAMVLRYLPRRLLTRLILLGCGCGGLLAHFLTLELRGDGRLDLLLTAAYALLLE